MELPRLLVDCVLGLLAGAGLALGTFMALSTLNILLYFHDDPVSLGWLTLSIPVGFVCLALVIRWLTWWVRFAKKIRLSSPNKFKTNIGLPSMLFLLGAVSVSLLIW